MNDPTSFWKNSPIGQRAKSTQVPREPYNFPELKTQSGTLAFEQIALYILQTNPQVFEEKGFAVMDEIWEKSSDENLKKYRSSLFASYPHPYSHRKAYLFRIPLETKSETTEKGIVKTKSISKLKATSNGKWFFNAKVCAFRNKDLGWTEKWEATEEMPTIDPETNEIVTPKGSAVNEFRYLYCSAFCLEPVKNKIVEKVNEAIKANPDLTEVYCFLLTLNVEKTKKDEGEGFWYNITADDAFFL